METLRDLDDAGLVNVMQAAVRLESAVTARRLAAVAELYRRRLHEQDAGDRELWCIDGWEQVAAEVAAAQGISRGRASGQLRYGLALAERLPKLAASFAAGDVDFVSLAHTRPTSSCCAVDTTKQLRSNLPDVATSTTYSLMPGGRIARRTAPRDV